MNKTALVTGSTQGVGLGIASGLIQHGYTVYINGRNKEKIETTVSQLGKLAKPAHFDVCNTSAVAGFFSLLKSQSTQLNLVVSNVGTGSISDIRDAFDVNFFSAVSVCQHAIPLLHANGHIITIASIAGCESISAPLAYSSAKAALIAYSKTLSDALAPKGIRVNTISPGNINAKGGVWEKKSAENPEAVERYIASNVPLQQFVTPDDISKGVLFLEESPRITGCNLVIDGGQTRSLI